MSKEILSIIFRKKLIGSFPFIIPKITTIFFLLIVIIFYIYWFTNNADIPFEFSQKDYDNYFFYLEAHRNNYGDLGNLYFDYVVKSILYFITTLLFLNGLLFKG